MKDLTLKRLSELIEESLKEKPTGDEWWDSRYNEQVHYVGHTQPYYNLFYLLAKELQPAFVVELGSWQSTGASAFAQGSPAARVVTIDIHKDGDNKAVERTLEAVAHFGGRLTYLNKWTWDAIEDVKAMGKKIDILFIDAWHNYDMAMREWNLYSPLLSDNAIVICDDILNNGGIFEDMVRFWEELPGLKLLDGAVHCGIPMGFIITQITPPNAEPESKAPIKTRKPRG